MTEPMYTGGRAFPAEGARVALITCRRCGAALLIDPNDDFNVLQRHQEWHEEAP